MTTEDDLLAPVDCVPQLTADVLLALHDGKSVDEVREQITARVMAEEPIDPEDYAAAVLRPTTQVATDDEALQAVLAESFARWQVYLHPTLLELWNQRLDQLPQLLRHQPPRQIVNHDQRSWHGPINPHETCS